MKSKAPFSLMRRFKSLKYAFNGLILFIKYEHNVWVHLVLSLLVVIAGIYFELDRMEWYVLILTIGFVLGMEAMNTAIEYCADFVTEEFDERIKAIKDISAAAVLISSIMAFIIGLIMFVPKFL